MPEEKQFSETLLAVMSYSGPALESHEMDANLFAEAIMANAEIARQVSGIIFGPEIVITVKIKGITKNGVRVDFVYILNQAANTIHLIRESQFVQSTIEFNEIIGAFKPYAIGAGLVGYSIYSWIKNKKAEGIDHVEDHGDTVTIFYKDGTVEIISAKLYRSLYCLKIVNAIKKIITPLSKRGIDKFKFYQQEYKEDPSTVIEKKDLPAFKAYIKSQLEHVKEYGIICSLDRPSYQRKASGWKLVREGQPDITVTIKDKLFLNEVAEDRIKVDPYSLFEVIYQEIRKENKNGNIISKYEVIFVNPIKHEDN